MFNSIYLKKLSDRAMYHNASRWRLGEILYEASLSGKKIIIDEQVKMYRIEDTNND